MPFIIRNSMVGNKIHKIGNAYRLPALSQDLFFLVCAQYCIGYLQQPCGWQCYSHFTDEETDTQRIEYLPEITQQ